MTTKPLDGLKILVVEDEYLVALDLQRLIERLGGKVLGPAARVGPALEMVQRDEPDGALLDVSLVGETSMRLADELRARGIPIILTSGYDVAALPQRLRDLPYVPKPIDMRTFRRIATTAFRRAALRTSQ
jgi:chemotaxis family two-component system sensor kinase Cph1